MEWRSVIVNHTVTSVLGHIERERVCVCTYIWKPFWKSQIQSSPTQHIFRVAYWTFLEKKKCIYILEECVYTYTRVCKLGPINSVLCIVIEWKYVKSLYKLSYCYPRVFLTKCKISNIKYLKLYICIYFINSNKWKQLAFILN